MPKLDINFLMHFQLFRKGIGAMGLCDIIGICNGVEKTGRSLEEPYPSKSQSYSYSDIPFASSQVQSIIVDAPSEVTF